MKFLSLRIIFLISIVMIVNFTSLSDSDAFYDKYFSLDTYCIAGDENCEAYTSPFDESPYVRGYTVAFYCDTLVPCLSGTFDTGGMGGGHWIAIPPLFYASYSGKLEYLDLFGIWIGRRMFGFGKDGGSMGYNFLFVGKRTSNFDW